MDEQRPQAKTRIQQAQALADAIREEGRLLLEPALASRAIGALRRAFDEDPDEDKLLPASERAVALSLSEAIEGFDWSGWERALSERENDGEAFVDAVGEALMSAAKTIESGACLPEREKDDEIARRANAAALAVAKGLDGSRWTKAWESRPERSWVPNTLSALHTMVTRLAREERPANACLIFAKAAGIDAWRAIAQGHRARPTTGLAGVWAHLACQFWPTGEAELDAKLLPLATTNLAWMNPEQGRGKLAALLARSQSLGGPQAEARREALMDACSPRERSAQAYVGFWQETARLTPCEPRGMAWAVEGATACVGGWRAAMDAATPGAEELRSRARLWPVGEQSLAQAWLWMSRVSEPCEEELAALDALLAPVAQAAKEAGLGEDEVRLAGAHALLSVAGGAMSRMEKGEHLVGERRSSWSARAAEMARKAIERGADPLAVDLDGLSLIELAVLARCEPLARLLLEAVGAAIDPQARLALKIAQEKAASSREGKPSQWAELSAATLRLLEAHALAAEARAAMAGSAFTADGGQSQKTERPRGRL
jgi:hypothetical protein